MKKVFAGHKLRLFMLVGQLACAPYFAANITEKPNLLCSNIFEVLRLKPSPLVAHFIKPAREEAPIAGYKMPRGWKPSRLNETYLYVIDEAGDVWISAEYLSPSIDGAYIATHRSVMAAMRRANPKVKFVAAGELTVKNGKYSILSNKAGSLRGDDTNLRFAHYAIGSTVSAGLPDNVALLDFSKSSDDPNNVHEERRALLANANKPEFKKMHARWEALIYRLHKLYPDPKYPGEVGGGYVDDIWDLYERKEALYIYDLRLVAGYMASYSESLDHLVAVSLTNPTRAEKVQRALEQFIEKRESLLHQKP